MSASRTEPGSAEDRLFDYRWAFTFPFRDPRAAPRFLLGAAIAWFSLPSVLLFGYAVRTARRALDGAPHPMAGWRRGFWKSVVATARVGSVAIFALLVVLIPVAVGVEFLFADGGDRLFAWARDIDLVLLLFLLVQPAAVLQVAASDGIPRSQWNLDPVRRMWEKRRTTAALWRACLPLFGAVWLFRVLDFDDPLLHALGCLVSFYCAAAVGGAAGHAGRIMGIGVGPPPGPPPPPPSPTETLPRSGRRRSAH